MSCEIHIPIQEIVDEVIKQANLGQYLPKQDGVATNLTLQGGVTLDTRTVEDFCRQLHDCFKDSHVASFERVQDSLILKLNDGTEFSVDLSMYALVNDITNLGTQLRQLIQELTDKVNTDINFLRQQLINGDNANRERIDQVSLDLVKQINDGDLELRDLITSLITRVAVLEEKVAECCDDCCCGDCNDDTPLPLPMPQ